MTSINVRRPQTVGPRSGRYQDRGEVRCRGGTPQKRDTPGNGRGRRRFLRHQSPRGQCRLAGFDVGGVSIAWSLAHAASTWDTPARLARYSTIPVIGILEAKEDFAGHAFELRILRLLAIFGLLDARKNAASTDRFVFARHYRKTQLYDRFFSFVVTLEPIEGGARH